MVADFEHFDKYRITTGPMASKPGDPFGGFLLPFRGILLLCIVADGLGWDHVSVSLLSRKMTSIKRCPCWEEMDHVKQTFFAPDEVAVQLHVSDQDHLSIHDYVLHIWKKQDFEYPLPHKGMV